MAQDLASDIAAVGAIGIIPKILDAAQRACGMGFVCVARVTEARWIACAVRDDIAFGLGVGGELKVDTTICHEIRQSGKAVVIDHVDADPVYRGHHTPTQYGLQSYISIPIWVHGEFFGTLCAIDPKPAVLHANHTLETFELFAELIGAHLETQAQLAQNATDISDERERTELRDQFIAVLGHDLRNPLASVDAALRLLRRGPTPERAEWIMDQVAGSVSRMTALVNDIMDFAHGSLGNGFPVTKVPCVALKPELDQVVSELRSGHPDREILSDIRLDDPFICDKQRIGQVLSNLMANALTHGDPKGPVSVIGRAEDGWFELSVSNQGTPIPPEVLNQLFRPFYRATPSSHQRGLGLGLYIASEIAKAHGATLTATSNPAETRFTLRIPLA